MTRIGGRAWIAILRRTWDEIEDDRASIVASGVAFRVALALFPAVALMVWAASRTVGPGEARALVGTLSDLLPDASRSVVGDAVESALRSNPADGRAEAPWLGALAPVAGVAVTLWTTNSGMKALFSALNIVYDKKESRPFLHRSLLTLAFTLGAMALLALSAGALLASPAVLARVGLGAIAAAAVHWGRWPALYAGFAMGLALLYRHAPNREREHWPLVTVGSALAAGALVLGTALFSWFTTRFMGLSATYGSLSTVVAFLLWLWIDFLVVLCCAELDSVIERQTGLYGGAGRGPNRRRDAAG
ncbi:YihY/virulence factor BrkB family protein [Lichenibacterium dinghuense]|uniref:YihY/virulence factor BrkB family protein n=1 Tax=Lichenibacterium dinghuense TaxID=2895977 RepID=UPI001F25E198|nr:YihY/virulence factor BrkB family protein [Lichenibacterium sp. 6Y81]